MSSEQTGAPHRRTTIPGEAELVVRARAGDQRAFGELVRLHSDRLFAVVVRFTADPVEAEDVMQEAFTRAWRSIGRFQGRSAFFTWLYRIGINEAKRRAERRPSPGKEIPIDESPLAEAPDWSQAPELKAAHRETARFLEETIRRLPLDYRTPLVLRDVEGLSTREAAEVMELSEAAFKSRLHRARMTVRRKLDEHFAGGDR